MTTRKQGTYTIVCHKDPPAEHNTSRANIFTVYYSPIQYVIEDSVILKGFADDHSVRKEFNANSREDKYNTMNVLEKMFNNINSWMSEMRLKFNPDKTEFIQFGYREQLKKCKTEHLNAGGNLIQKSKTVKYARARD